MLIGESIIYNPSGKYPANDAAYIFLGARDFATLGAFDENALLISGQKVNYHISGCNVNGLPRLEFSEPVKPDIHYHYLPGKKDNFGDQPIIIDEIAEEYIEVRKITDYEGDGTFAIQDLSEHTMIMQYGGFRLLNNSKLDQKFRRDEASPAFGSYTQNIGFCDGVKVDIPKGFEDTSKYNGTLAHKAQHSFGEANVYLTTVDTARYGLLVGMITKRNIKRGEQVMNNYLYYNGNPELACSEIAPVGLKYYCEAWLEFKLKNPEKGANFLKKKGQNNWMKAAIDNYSLPEDPV